jgi:hypothetical protein
MSKAMRCTRALIMCALAVSCANQPPPPGDATTVSDPITRTGENGPLLVGLERYLANPGGGVEIIETLRWGTHAYALFEFGGQSQQTQGFASFIETDDGWTTDEVEMGPWPRPRPGSGDLVLFPVRGGAWPAIGGYADPTLSEIRILDSSGVLVDLDDDPGKGTIVLARPGGQLVAMRGGTAVVAQSIPPEELVLVKLPGADSAAREVAREFADAITAGDWAAAARLVTPRTNQWDLTLGLRRFMGNQSWTVTSEPDPRDFGYAVQLAQESAEARRWLLSLSLTQDQGQPRVYAYQLASL